MMAGTVTKAEYVRSGGYLNVDPSFQYLTLRGRNYGFKGLTRLFIDLADDNILKHVDISENITRKETNDPEKMTAFLKALGRAMKNNTTMTALDLCGNSLFYYTPHPCNEHLIDYLTAFTDALIPSHVSHLDISDNHMVGANGRLYSGFRYLMTKLIYPAGVVLKARKNFLHSYCCQIISEGIGTGSNLEELDISDNLIGKDPFGQPASDGISTLCTQLMNTLRMRVLRLARNSIMDDDIATIANAVSVIPTLQILDLSGNQCAFFGARALKYMLMSHGTLRPAEKHGLTELYLSHNPLASEGILELCEALPSNYTLSVLALSACEIDRETMYVLQSALALNSSVIELDNTDNRVTPYVENLPQAEVEAMRIINSLKTHPLKANAANFNTQVYSAVAKKLRFLSEEHLAPLHANPSFNVVATEMRDCLHVLCPPGRVKLITNIKESSKNINPRLELSRKIDHQLKASRVIFNVVIRWMREWQAERAFEKEMEKLKKARAAKDLEES